MKTKKCEVCGRPAWWGGKNPRCQYHPLEKPKKLKPKSEKRQKVDAKTGGQKALFEMIWNTRERKSFISGLPITEPKASVFAHVIPKGKYPRFRLYEKNIVLLTHDEHTLFDFGTEEQREQYARLTGADWNKLYNLREELLREYNRRL